MKLPNNSKPVIRDRQNTQRGYLKGITASLICVDCANCPSGLCCDENLAICSNGNCIEGACMNCPVT